MGMSLKVIVGMLVLVLTLPTAGANAALPNTADPQNAAPQITPLPKTDADYQIGGAARPAPNVGIVVRDRKAKPAKGHHNVCYVNAFQTQPDEAKFWKTRRGLLLKNGGQLVRDTEWDEHILDIRTLKKRKRLARIVGRWIDQCAKDGFDAVEFDNLDSFARSRKLIKPRHTKRFATLLVRQAHRAGLAAGQKNWSNFDGTRIGFDFAVAEECGRYRECKQYWRHYGSQVIAVEYRRKDFRQACRTHSDRFAVVLRDRDVTKNGRRAWCR